MVVKLSPPITVSAILIAGLAVAGWVGPPPEEQEVTVRLPHTVYNELLRRGAARQDTHGKSLTAAEVIQALVKGQP